MIHTAAFIDFRLKLRYASETEEFKKGYRDGAEPDSSEDRKRGSRVRDEDDDHDKADW